MTPQERAALVARLRYGVKSDLTPLERVPRIAADEIEALAQQVATLRAEFELILERIPQIREHPQNIRWLEGRVRRVLAQTKPKVTT